MTIPQTIMIVWFAVSLAIGLLNHGNMVRVSFWSSTLVIVIEIYVLYLGGFWWW
jgi:hypothetical protein